MIDSIKKVLGIGPSADYAQLVKDGAIILDVRTKGEFASGHIEGAVNISVDRLRDNLHQLKDKQKPIITCCASGMRSGAAKSLLEASGYNQVYNGGSWMGLRGKIR
ncbi:MAG TPA: rhodanese-like domain-containing protein [Cyclobacteriaceae bacterium]|nr:rhodanese-like domain-containing protein [Cyclobacteriaceae bacterium]